MPSGPGRMTQGPHDRRDAPRRPARHAPSSSPSTRRPTGSRGERCELTEVGAVLVGGGELHDRWSLARRRRAPLVARHPALHRHLAGDGRTPRRRPRPCCPSSRALLRGRVLVAHYARFDQRVLRQAFARAALDWPEPPVLCTVALARRLRAAAAPPRARRAGRRARDRGRRRPPRAAGRGDLRARVLRAVRAPVRARARRSARRSRCCARAAARARARSRAAQAPRATSARTSPRCRRTRASTSSATPTAAPLYVGKSVCLRTRARAHFTTPATWTGQAEHVDYQATRVRARRAPARGPADQGAAAARQRARQAHRRRLRLPALPARHPVPDPRGRARAGRRATRHASGRCAAAPRAAELVEQLNSLFGLRHCGRALPPAPAPVRVRPDGPLPLAVPAATSTRTSTASGSTRRCELFVAEPRRRRRAARPRRRADARGVGGAALRARRLAAAPPRAARARCSAASAACCARPTRARGSCSRRTRPTRGALRRVLDRRRPRASTGAALPERPGRARAAHGRRAAPRAPRRELGGWLPPEEIDETRLVGAWIAAHDPPALELGELAPSEEALMGFVADARATSDR